MSAEIGSSLDFLPPAEARLSVPRESRCVSPERHPSTDRTSTGIGNHEPGHAERSAARSHTAGLGDHVASSDKLNHNGWAEPPRTQYRLSTTIWRRRNHLQGSLLLNGQF
jgi:hypothetical protein